MRKNLISVPVFGPGQKSTEIPIDHISPQSADDLVASGKAISLKGRAIRMIREQISSRRGLSAYAGPELIERYASAVNSGCDPLAIAATKAWIGPIAAARGQA